jgi:hypothetical protein
MPHFRDFYSGQDLHIVRNNEELIVSQHFDNNQSSHTFQVVFPSTTFPAEGITVVNSAGVFSIKANAFSGTKTISILKIRVTANGESKYLFIHIHDSVSKAWLSPAPITIYRNHGNVRLGLSVKFNDGIIANVSWYRGLAWSNVTLPNYLAIDPSSGLV